MRWPEAQFADVAEIVTGNTPPKKDLKNYGPGVPWVKPPDLDAWEPVTETEETLSPQGQQLARLLPKGTVMVCCIGSIGRVGIAGTTLATNQQINSLIFGQRVDSKFGYYYCKFIRQQFQSAARNAVVPILNKSNFARIRIPLPPLSEQHRIVEILDQADELRKKRAEADSKAARILPALFHRVFGDPAINPMGWPLVHIGKMVEPIERRDPSVQPEDPFIYIDIAGVNGQLGLITQAKKLMGSEAPSRARQIVKANDVIISTVRPYLRATALVPSHCDKQICSTGFCVLRAKAGIGFGFLYALSRLQSFTDQLNARARGASYPAVTDADIFNLPVPHPNDHDVLKSFDRQVLDVLVLQDKRRIVARRIDNLFETFLHRAFAGVLTAKWREVHMKEVLEELELQAKYLV